MAAVAISPAEWAGELSVTADRLRRPLGPLLEVLKVAAVADAKLNFDRSADPAGRPWPPLAHPRPSGGNKPLRDKGLLMASITGRVSGNSVVVGTNRPGASLHQHGGAVTPKRAKFLTIPATREAARSRARDFPRPLAPIVGKSGTSGVLVDKKTNQVMYYLAKRVVVPARPFLGAGPRLLAKLAQLVRDYFAAPWAGG